ncbi:hypothetical protein EDD21DRAFT_145138 [Dissophora ornata]|nr:hypothetical protein EDD21DRAFT_145138 [Dissophora ornata]
METKKRPNDDSQEQAENSSAGLADSAVHSTAHNADDALPMDVDSTKLEAPSTAVDSVSSTDAHRHAENQQSTGEANKRLKMTMEADVSGAGYSPSVDITDPSKETKGFTEWVEKIDEDDKVKDTADLGLSEGPLLQATVTSISASDPSANASKGSKVDTESAEQIDGDGKPKATTLIRNYRQQRFLLSAFTMAPSRQTRNPTFWSNHPATKLATQSPEMLLTRTPLRG